MFHLKNKHFQGERKNPRAGIKTSFPFRTLPSVQEFHLFGSRSWTLPPVWNFTNPQRYILNYLSKNAFVRGGCPPRTNVSFNYSMISATMPEPTVLPPSRIANVKLFSIAIGLISSTVMSTLSPGRHISTPSGSLITPVTSVVLK